MYNNNNRKNEDGNGQGSTVTEIERMHTPMWMMTEIQPINQVLIKVHGTHHPPVDVPISTRDGR